MRELAWMADGKAEMFGGMTGNRREVIPYDPIILASWND